MKRFNAKKITKDIIVNGQTYKYVGENYTYGRKAKVYDAGIRGTYFVFDNGKTMYNVAY